MNNREYVASFKGTIKLIIAGLESIFGVNAALPATMPLLAALQGMEKLEPGLKDMDGSYDGRAQAKTMPKGDASNGGAEPPVQRGGVPSVSGVRLHDQECPTKGAESRAEPN